MTIKITINTEHTEKKIKQLEITIKQINQLINTESILYEKLGEKNNRTLYRKWYKIP